MPVWLRREAAWVLRDIHTKDAVPFFIRLLDDSDPQIRQHAFDGLSLFVNNLGIITPESVPSFSWAKPVGPAPFRTKQTDQYEGMRGEIPLASHPTYVAFWKSWWEKNRLNFAQ